MSATQPRLVCEVEEGPPEHRTKRSVVVDASFKYFGRSRTHLRGVAAKERRARGMGEAEDGTADAHVEELSSDVVSSIHCLVWYEKSMKQFFVSDCKSRNGTWLARPAAQEAMRNYEFIGDKQTKTEKGALSIMSAIKAANVIILVVAIEGVDSSSTRNDLSDAFNYTDGGTMTEDVSKQDMVVSVIDGPSVGQHHILKYGENVVVGRTAPGSKAAAPSGPAHPPTKRISIYTRARHLSRNHVLIGHSTDLSLLRPASVQALSKNGVMVARAPDMSKATFADLRWELVPFSEVVSLAFGDMVRCGNDTILLIADHAGPPQRLPPPLCTAATPTSLTLSWSKAVSATDVKGYILAMAPGPALDDDPPPHFARLAASSHDPETALARSLEQLTQLDLAFSNEYGGGQRTTTVAPLEPGRIYFFRLQARNAGGESAWSAVVAHATTPAGAALNHAPLPPYLAPALRIHNLATGAFSLDDGESGDDTDDDDDGGASSGTVGTLATSFSQATLASPAHGAAPRAQPRTAGSIRWKKGKIIGIGAQGKVYVGQDLETLRVMAVKEIICMESAVEASQLANIEGEIDMLRTLNHPNIVKYIGMNRRVEDGQITLHLFLEYVAGGSLRAFIKQMDKNGIDASAARLYTKQILEGLAYLHASSIVHRDIKSANILLAIFGPHQVCKIADFGASKTLSALSDDFASVVGTPNFMAPEVIRQAGGSSKSDIWSVGCTVIEMLTGNPPWSELEPQSALYHMGTTTTGPRLPDGIDAPLADFLANCFVIDPPARASAADLLASEWIHGPDDTPHHPPALLPPHLASDAPATPLTRPRSPASDGETETELGPTPPPPASFAAGRAARGATGAGKFNMVLNTQLDAAKSADPPPQSPSFKDQTQLIPWNQLTFFDDIGKGGYGSVTRAEYLGLDVAVKFLTKVENIDEFISEAALLATLRHPNCVLYMGVCANEVEQRYGIVMEYLDGGDLHAAIHAASTPLDLATRIRILTDVASGLVYLHSSGIAHRDIKLRNILLDKRSYQAKLADFGLSTPEFHQTAATLRYAAPEVLAGERAADALADVYSFGLVMLEVLTSVKPFAFLRDAKDRYNDLTLAPGAPTLDPLLAPLVPLMRACWSFEADRRPSMRSVLSSLKAVLAPDAAPTASPPASPPRAPPRPSAPHWLSMFADDDDDSASASASAYPVAAVTPPSLPTAPSASDDDDVTATQLL